MILQGLVSSPPNPPLLKRNFYWFCFEHVGALCLQGKFYIGFCSYTRCLNLGEALMTFNIWTKIWKPQVEIFSEPVSISSRVWITLAGHLDLFKDKWDIYILALLRSVPRMTAALLTSLVEVQSWLTDHWSDPEWRLVWFNLTYLSM